MIEPEGAGRQSGVQSSVQLAAVVSSFVGKRVQRQRRFALQRFGLLVDGVKVVLAARDPDVAEVSRIVFRLGKCETGDRQSGQRNAVAGFCGRGRRFGAVVGRCKLHDESGGVPHLPGPEVEADKQAAQLRNVVKVADNHTVFGEVSRLS